MRRLFIMACLLSVSVDAGAADPKASLSLVAWTELAELQKRALGALTNWRSQSRALGGRARHSAWIPMFRVRYGHDFDDSYRASVDNALPNESTPVDSSARTGIGHRFELEARWRLGDILYHPVEVRALGLKRLLIRGERTIKAEVTKAYTGWIMARDTRRRAQTPGEAQLASSRMLRWSLRLDTLTGGFFSRSREVAGDP